jgi:DNA-binding LytR/AlgR family response regulator
MKELKIAICDDQQIHIETIVRYIRNMNLDFDYKLITTHEPEVLLSKLDDEKIDIAFLDIEMGEISGIDVGKEIRTRYKDCVIVFITGFRDFALDAYQIKAIDYIIKPISEENFRTVMKEAVQKYMSISDGYGRNYFTIENSEGVVQLEYDNIYYFEKIQRKIRVHTLKKSYEFYGSLKEVKEYLNKDDYFTQCHQGYLVNTHKIVEIRKDKVVITGANVELPLSRRYRTELIEAFEDVLFKAK